MHLWSVSSAMIYVGLSLRSWAFDRRTTQCPAVVADRMDNEDCRESDLSLARCRRCWISASHESIRCQKTASPLHERTNWTERERKIFLPLSISKAAMVNRTGCSVTMSTDLFGPRGRPGRQNVPSSVCPSLCSYPKCLPRFLWVEPLSICNKQENNFDFFHRQSISLFLFHTLEQHYEQYTK